MKEVFKITDKEIPKGKIKSISFPDWNKEKRIEHTGGDRIPVTIEFEKPPHHVILCGKTIIEEE